MKPSKVTWKQWKEPQVSWKGNLQVMAIIKLVEVLRLFRRSPHTHAKTSSLPIWGCVSFTGKSWHVRVNMTRMGSTRASIHGIAFFFMVVNTNAMVLCAAPGAGSTRAGGASGGGGGGGGSAAATTPIAFKAWATASAISLAAKHIVRSRVPMYSMYS